jgi:hypothetical protein
MSRLRIPDLQIPGLPARRDTQPAFAPARAKLWIGSIDTPWLRVEAQYNPKEIQIDKQVPWQGQNTRDNRPGSERTERTEQPVQSDVEFNGAPTRSMTIELLFDRYESGRSIEVEVQALEALSSVLEPGSPSPDRNRPHHCIVAWGEGGVGKRPFLCVIENLTTKYTMWTGSGMPVRVVCTVKLKESRRITDAQAARAKRR